MPMPCWSCAGVGLVLMPVLRRCRAAERLRGWLERSVSRSGLAGDLRELGETRRASLIGASAEVAQRLTRSQTRKSELPGGVSAAVREPSADKEASYVGEG